MNLSVCAPSPRLQISFYNGKLEEVAGGLRVRVPRDSSVAQLLEVLRGQLTPEQHGGRPLRLMEVYQVWGGGWGGWCVCQCQSESGTEREREASERERACVLGWGGVGVGRGTRARASLVVVLCMLLPCCALLHMPHCTKCPPMHASIPNAQ